MQLPFSSFKRTDLIKEIKKQMHFDLLIIGGGITGAGIALDATLRGMSTVLFEMQDFASGTSSRSTKLIHGGLRYLKQFEFGMVAAIGKERAIVYENGPHVTTPEWMLLPIFQKGTFGKFSTSIGLRVYDFLASVKKAERRRMLSKEETIKKAPVLKKDGLLGGGYYVEYRTDDARLTIEVIKEAVQQGAKAINYMKVDSFIYDNRKVVGVKVMDQLSGEAFELYAKKIVNASGPWVDTLREKDHSKKGKQLQLTKGVHLVIDQKHFPLQQAIYFDTPDGRMVFAIPRDGKTYVGTTDTKYEGEIIHPRMAAEDRTYLIEAIRDMFPCLRISEEHIESSWTGLRPLIYEDRKNASEISRKDEIWESESGLITIAGGKLTGYRKMAETVVDLISKQLSKEYGLPFLSCRTKHWPISGGNVGGPKQFPDFIQSHVEEGIALGLNRSVAEKFVRRYGSNIPQVYELLKIHGKKAHSQQLPLDLIAALHYSMEFEMAVKPEDFFIRRTGALFFDIQWVQQYKLQVLEYMAKQLHWSMELKNRYTKELDNALHNAIVPVEATPKKKIV